MNYFDEIAKVLVVPVVGITAAAWLIRSIIIHVLAKDIGRFKDQLAMSAKERETRFNILQSKRAEVIEQLYGKLIDFMAAVERCVSPLGYKNDPPKEEQLKAVGEAQGAFLMYYMRNRIYFSEPICDGIDSLFNALVPKVRKFGLWLAFQKRYPDQMGNQPDAWDEAWKAMQDQVPPIMRSIERDFRDLLGVEGPRAAP